MLSVTKVFTFEAAHAISSYDGACKNIHGHSYELHVTVVGKVVEETAMIMDFKKLKSIVQQEVLNDFDHALLLKINELNTELSHSLTTKLVWMKQEPTAEYLLLEILARIRNQLPKGVFLKRLKLYETATCYAEWDNTAL